MVKRNAHTPPGDLFNIKLVSVPIELELWHVVRSIQFKMKTLVAIYRAYDYVNQRRGGDIYVSIRSKVEYETLKQMRTIVIEGREIVLDFAELYVGTAIREEKVIEASDEQIGSSAIGLKLTDLREVSTITSIYVRKLLYAFESHNNRDIIGLNFIYDNRRDSIRPFGFIYFCRKSFALPFHGNNARMMGELLACELSTRTPIVLSGPNKSLMTTTPATFTADIRNANLLSDTNPVNEEVLVEAVSELNLRDHVEEMQIDQDSDNNSILSLDFDYDLNFED